MHFSCSNYRHVYQEEKTALKKQLKRLSKEVEMLRTQHDQLAATVNQLEADNAELTDENRRMAEAASERETIVHELEEEAGSLHTRWENRLHSRLDCVLAEVAR